MATPKDKYIAQAVKLVERNQYDKAIKEYLKVVALDDKDVRIWLKIGDLYAKLNNKAEASTTYLKVAEHYSHQGFYLKAVAVYKQILKLDPKQVSIHQRLADLYKHLGLLTDAMQQYEAVAAYWHQQGDTQRALFALKQIVELDPETVANRIKLAELYSKERMPREAIEEFTRAAEQLKEMGRMDDYMKVAERLLFHSPDNRPVSKELARLYIEKGDPRRALPKLQICFKNDPRDVEVLSLLADSFETLEQWSKAVSVLKELARIHEEASNRQARDQVYRKILTLQPGDPDAEAALAHGPTRKPTPYVQSDPPLLSGSQIFERSGSFVKPAAALGSGWQQNNEVSPDDFAPGPQDRTVAEMMVLPQINSSILNMGTNPEATQAQPVDNEQLIRRILNETDVYIKYRLFDKAVEHVRRVFDYEPNNVTAREKLKAIYLSLGRPDRAIAELLKLADSVTVDKRRRYLREVLELDPNHQGAKAMLGDKSSAASEDEEVEELSDDLLFEEEPSLPREIAYDLHSDEVELEREPVEIESPSSPVISVHRPIERYRPTDSETQAVEAGVRRIDHPQTEEQTFGDFLDEEGGKTRFEPVPASLAMRPAKGPAAASSPAPPPDLTDELDEADFFLQQDLFDEARAILQEMDERYPNRQEIKSRLAKLDKHARLKSAKPSKTLQDFAPDFGELTSRESTITQAKPVFIDGQDSEESARDDLETHYDLGIAYKEMGLYQDAISEFKLVLKEPTREVQCHLMIGLCLVAKGSLSEAVSEFKKGLYVERITESETLSLYFELGQSYQQLGDAAEALYYFEKVLRRDANFRNVDRRIESLRAAGFPATGKPKIKSG